MHAVTKKSILGAYNHLIEGRGDRGERYNVISRFVRRTMSIIIILRKIVFIKLINMVQKMNSFLFKAKIRVKM